ncbi:DUF6880 family protein [Brachybacterium tyrofermentans]|uniref:DUF6880 family protein n=1 Tax=Brachybacterium tyrofermentans TaxID=47848 RepID=UPI003FD096E6
MTPRDDLPHAPMPSLHDEHQQLRAFLHDQDPRWLAERLLAASTRDPWLQDQLREAAGFAVEPDADEQGIREQLREVITIEDFVSYREAPHYFRDVEEVLDRIDDLVDDGQADDAARLALIALDLLEEHGQRVDDSDGGLVSALRHVEEIHLRACEAGDVDPLALAEALAERALDGSYDTFMTVFPAYTEVLGQAGRERYREVIEARWEALPAPTGTFDGRRAQVRLLREHVAEALGGIDALVSVLEDDLDRAVDHVRLVRALLKAGRAEEAVQKTEHARREFPEDAQLLAQAAESHHLAGDDARAGELAWEGFAAAPRLATFQRLKECSGETFPAWRLRALTLVEDHLLQRPRRSADWSLLVEILLWDGDDQGAWNAARRGDCHAGLWRDLARRRAPDDPAGAITAMLAAAEKTILLTQRRAYAEAAQILRRAREYYVADGRADAFTVDIRRIREDHSHRPALQDEFTRAGLP